MVLKVTQVVRDIKELIEMELKDLKVTMGIEEFKVQVDLMVLKDPKDIMV